MNTFRLKILAIISMTIDHLGVVFNTIHAYNIVGNDIDHYMTDAYWQMRVVGRLAFPIFCFLIAEGCAHTKDNKKYIARLAAFALISQVPYQLFSRISLFGVRDMSSYLLPYSSGNVLITLALGAVAVFLYSNCYKSKGMKRLLYIVGIVAAFLFVAFLRGEYDVYGVLLILLLYALRPKNESATDSKIPGNKYAQAICCAALTFLYYYGNSLFLIGALSSALLLLLYNGQPGKYKWKWAFYIYYPAHMLVLFAVMYIIMS